MSVILYTPGNVPTYRFYISDPSSMSHEVFPLNFLESSLVNELTDKAFYRRNFSGSLLFGTNSKVLDDDGGEQNRKDDWTLLWGFEQTNPCGKLYLDIHKIVAGVTTEYWTGYFSTTDGKFDIDQCTFEVTPTLNDDYTLLGNLDTAYSILEVTTFVTTIALRPEGNITYTNNRFLFDLIEFLADKIMPGVTVSSEFFTEATNPVTLAANHLLYLTIAQKSDIMYPLASDPATAPAAMMSWNGLMDILWGMFQVQWNYIPDVINVEHISKFTSVVGIDLRTQLSAVATNKYSYLKEKMPKYEKFSFMEAQEENFIGVPIRYESNCVDQNDETNSVEISIPVTTDLDYIINHAEDVNKDGFVILCNYSNGSVPPNYFVEIEYGCLSGRIRHNMHLSWANLHNRYWRHNRVLIKGYMNGNEIDFWTSQKNKIQKCSVIICETFDPTKKITTELGYTHFGDGTDEGNVPAKVQSAKISPTGLIELSLLYGSVENTPTPIEDIIFTTYDDWYLPGLSLLDAMYTNLHLNAVGGFVNTRYWSSDIENVPLAWVENFINGEQYVYGKDNMCCVRAMRKWLGVTGTYLLKDIGPAGGWIFYIDDLGNGTSWFSECAPSDQSAAANYSEANILCNNLVIYHL